MRPGFLLIQTNLIENPVVDLRHQIPGHDRHDISKILILSVSKMIWLLPGYQGTGLGWDTFCKEITMQSVIVIVVLLGVLMTQLLLSGRSLWRGPCGPCTASWREPAWDPFTSSLVSAIIADPHPRHWNQSSSLEPPLSLLLIILATVLIAIIGIYPHRWYPSSSFGLIIISVTHRHHWHRHSFG